MIKTIKLDNGLTVILNQDKKKNRTFAYLYINAGGTNTKVYVDNKLTLFPYGVAHFLEHYLIENSIYGDLGDYFDKEYINYNGYTSIHKTTYYLSTVHDFE